MWFGKHKKIWIGILAAAAFAVLAVVFIKAGDGGSAGVKGGLQGAAAFIAKPVSNAAEGIRKGFRGIFRFKEVTAENERLSEEADRLKQENAELALTREEKEELEDLQKVFHYESAKEGKVAAADIVSLDYSSWQGVFTIDRGSESGIRAGCTVISGDGLVGKVTEVSNGTAKVSTVLADNNKISFQTAGNKKQMGVLQSDGKKGLFGYLLEEEVHIEKGDIVTTSGIGLYSKGFKIGKVTEVEKKREPKESI